MGILFTKLWRLFNHQGKSVLGTRILGGHRLVIVVRGQGRSAVGLSPGPNCAWQSLSQNIRFLNEMSFQYFECLTDQPSVFFVFFVQTTSFCTNVTFQILLYAILRQFWSISQDLGTFLERLKVVLYSMNNG